jgi:hypothetical protein
LTSTYQNDPKHSKITKFKIFESSVKKKESTTTVCPGMKTSTGGWFYEIVCQLEGESDYSLMVHHFVLG